MIRRPCCVLRRNRDYLILICRSMWRRCSGAGGGVVQVPAAEPGRAQLREGLRRQRHRQARRRLVDGRTQRPNRALPVQLRRAVVVHCRVRPIGVHRHL